MPPVFQDVMRDLIANGRKYAAPGGRFWIASEVDVGTRIRIQSPRPASIAPAVAGAPAAGAA